MKKILKVVLVVIIIIIMTSSFCLAASVYTVKSGDTLSKIARTYNVTVSDIMAANPSIKNSSLIYIGQKITIPSSKFVSYTVQNGDTFWGIANRFEISVAQLKEANPNITDISRIYVGQTVLIPDTNSLLSYEQQVFELVNKERANRGIELLKYNSELARVARFKSQDMIDKGYFSHYSPTYGSPFQMMEKFGLRFSAAGENIAYGQRTASEVMNTWMNSSGHRANILSGAYTQIGIGVAKASNGTLYWTQMFIKPY
ncbi:MAG: LysM peptidoglycan-binding domain-containing protein [Christensenellales bacterium]|jgi:uncharacterized YkwD family protein